MSHSNSTRPAQRWPIGFHFGEQAESTRPARKHLRHRLCITGPQPAPLGSKNNRQIALHNESKEERNNDQKDACSGHQLPEKMVQLPMIRIL